MQVCTAVNTVMPPVSIQLSVVAEKIEAAVEALYGQNFNCKGVQRLMTRYFETVYRVPKTQPLPEKTVSELPTQIFRSIDNVVAFIEQQELNEQSKAILRGHLYALLQERRKSHKLCWDVQGKGWNGDWDRLEYLENQNFH